MTTWFVSRHPGAIEWARRKGIVFDHTIAHINGADIKPGDTVMGSLPVNLAAEVCGIGARYLHLSLKLPSNLRGRELSVEQLEALGAQLEAFDIRPLP